MYATWESYVTQFAPIMRELTVGFIMFAFLAMQFAKLRMRFLNVLMGLGLILVSLLMGGGGYTLYVTNQAGLVSRTLSPSDLLLIYVIGVPLLMSIYGILIACVGWGPQPAFEEEKAEDRESAEQE